MAANPQLFKRLTDSESLTDVLIQMEDFLDSLDIYVFKNWFEGEIVQGPDIRRYWVAMTLKYEYEQMPDPAGALRLLKHNVKVTYRKIQEEMPREIQSEDDMDDQNKPKLDMVPVWLVDIQIPRRFIEELDDSDLEMHTDDEIVDVEDVSDARDENIDDEDAFTDDNDDPDVDTGQDDDAGDDEEDDL